MIFICKINEMEFKKKVVLVIKVKWVIIVIVEVYVCSFKKSGEFLCYFWVKLSIFEIILLKENFLIIEILYLNFLFLNKIII